MSAVSRAGAGALAILGVLVMSWFALSRRSVETSAMTPSAEAFCCELHPLEVPTSITDASAAMATPGAAAPTLAYSRQRVRVIARLAPDCADTRSLHAELLRVEARGGLAALTPRIRQSHEISAELLRLTSAAVASEPLRSAEAEFDIEEAGHYAAAWHAWVRVPQTSTWRVVRGQGEPISIEFPCDRAERSLEVEVSATALALDATLDAEPKSNLTSVTPKDG